MELAFASKGERAGTYLIDLIPAVIVGFIFGWIPIVGPMIAGFILACYWLLRDITGGSIGKLLLGLRVVGKNGEEAKFSQRILRNVTIAAGPALLIIPLVGPFVALPITAILILVEIVLVLSQGERLGDRIAGTAVIHRAKVTAAT